MPRRSLAGVDIETCAGDIDALQILRQRAIEVVVTDPATPFQEDLALVAEASRNSPWFENDRVGALARLPAT